MDRCALFVDAGYVLADGAMAVHGTRRRESVSWDYAGLLQLFGNLAAERTGLPLLRCYWYEATVEGRRSAEHDMLADLPGVKLRVAKMRPGHREGVESEIHRDLTTLARNKAVSDVMVVSAEEDLAQVIADVQDMGMRVTLLHVDAGGANGDGTLPRALRQECDDVVEVSAEHLRPYVELITGAEPPRPDESAAPASAAPHPVAKANGHSVSAANGQAPLPKAGEGTQPEPGQQERAERTDGGVAAEYAPAADFGGGVDYSASVDYGAPVDYAPAAVHQAPVDQGPGIDYRSALEYGAAEFGPVPDYAVPLAAPTLAVREERPRLGADLPPYHPGPGSAQVRRLPTRGPVPGGPDLGQQPPGPPAAPGPLPPVPALTPVPPPMAQPTAPPGPPQLGGQAPAGQQPGGQLPSGQPTGAQPALPVAPVAPVTPVAPVVSLDSNGTGGYAAARGGPHQVIPGPGAPVGTQPPPLGPPVPGGQNAQAGPGAPGGQAGLPDAPSGPIGLVGPGGYPGGAPGVSLGDAVQSAHEEGQAFGESVARDAPALWLEAVLARKPRMPSDLEARLLQGSTLPIDFLLHDEVRHALRRGFWDALERARR